MKKSKIEIIDVKLDINIEDEIKKQTDVDAATKSKVDNIIERAKLRVANKRNPEEELWTQKFEALFTAMLPKDGNPQELTKEAVSVSLGIAVEQLGSIIAKFKKFLRDVKSNQWVIVLDKNSKKERVYKLARFS